MDYTLHISDGSILTASAGESLLQALQKAGFSRPESPCGGHGLCGKCLAGITGLLVSPDGKTSIEAHGERLLLCRWHPAGDCRIALDAAGSFRVLTDGAGNIPGGVDGLGLAVDIGTTTLAVYLYDLATGHCLSMAGERNSQAPFGADVISRITACKGEGLAQLSRCIREQICHLTETLCNRQACNPADIRRCVIAGNTVMEHIFAGIDPSSIGVAPFTPLSLFGTLQNSDILTPALAPDCELYIAPAVAAYVGGDVTAGMQAAGLLEQDGLTLYIDIGTNGEMALGDKSGYLCCATAAGPAFEGALISCGMGASDGAIDRVSADDLSLHVIGGTEAIGLCGSGLLDAAAAMLSLGIIDETGRLLPPEEAPVAYRDRLQNDGELRFMLSDKVYLSAGDIRQLQMAKAAICAGAVTLLEHAHKSAADIHSLIIAGGFGSHMKVESALAIGLLPPVESARIRFVGNAAGAGAALALTDNGRKMLTDLASRCSYFELSGSSEFMDNYIDCMSFEA